MKCEDCESYAECMMNHYSCPDSIPFTNADHIRSMTDEELAESITQLLYESLKASKCDWNLADDYKKQLLNWLQQQYKEDAE